MSKEYKDQTRHSRARTVKADTKSREVNRTVEEKTEGNVTLRRTTIDEIEIKQEDTKSD